MPVRFGQDGKQVQGGGKRRQRNNSAGAGNSIQPKNSAAAQAPKTVCSFQQEKDDGGDDHRQQQQRQSSSAVAVGGSSSSSSSSSSISDQDLAVTISTLAKLSSNEDSFVADKRFKAVRSAVHPLMEALSTTPNVSALVARVTSAIADSDWLSAVATLQRMRRLGLKPKLGSVQRFVREADVATRKEDGHPDDAARFRFLDALTRCAAPEQIGRSPTPPQLMEAAMRDERKIVMVPDIDFGRNSTQMLPDLSESALARWKDPATNPMAVLQIDKAASRNPPNQYDMIIWREREDAPPILDPSAEAISRVTRIDLPEVPETFLLRDVFSTEEAHNIIQMCTGAAGFIPDRPLNSSVSMLADHVCWLPSENFMKTLVARCMPHLPNSVAGAQLCRDPAATINKRFRTYRYIPGATYRNHIDGAWPPSGIDAANDRYVYDISEGRILSRMTFLIYLNDGFEGGHTRYLLPAQEDGFTRCLSVKPRCGSVLVFPHGDYGLLQHEGSGVTRGTKIIIRTEVEFVNPK